MTFCGLVVLEAEIRNYSQDVYKQAAEPSIERFHHDHYLSFVIEHTV